MVITYIKASWLIGICTCDNQDLIPLFIRPFKIHYFNIKLHGKSKQFLSCKSTSKSNNNKLHRLLKALINRENLTSVVLHPVPPLATICFLATPWPEHEHIIARGVIKPPIVDIRWGKPINLISRSKGKKC